MNKSLLFSLSGILFWVSPQVTLAADQTLALSAGWNAVFLELEPAQSDPAQLFAGQPVEMCAAWLPSRAKVESLTDLAALPEKSTGWHIWQPAASPSAFLNNLRSLAGRQALLIKASAATTFTVSGTPRFERRTWTAPSFNFTGFDVDPAAPPTFARFFDGSKAHTNLKAFKLVAGKWQAVSPAETIQRNHAYWIWTQEGSDFQGPLDITLPLGGAGVLTLSNGAAPTRLEARSNGTLPVTLSLTTSGSLPLLQSAGGNPEAPFSSGISLPLSVKSDRPVTLRRPLDSAQDSAASLVQLRGGGMNFLLPVRGRN